MEQQAELVAVCALWPWPWKRKRKLRYLTWYPYTAAHYGRAPVCKVQSSTLAGWQRLARHCWADNKARGAATATFQKHTFSNAHPPARPCYRPPAAIQSGGEIQNYWPASKCSFSTDLRLVFRLKKKIAFKIKKHKPNRWNTDMGHLISEVAANKIVELQQQHSCEPFATDWRLTEKHTSRKYFWYIFFKEKVSFLILQSCCSNTKNLIVYSNVSVLALLL